MIPNSKFLAVVAGIALAASLPAAAQQRWTPPEITAPRLLDPKPPPSPHEVLLGKSMQVKVVRSMHPGCEPDCPEWIAAQGVIDEKTPGEFRKVLARLGNRKLPVFMDSNGGSVDPSLAIGRMIRAKGLDVAVTKTVIVPCYPQDAECLKRKARGIEPGRPDAKVSRCASACAFVLAGGVRRYVGSWTIVGVHEIKSVQTWRYVLRQYRVQPGSIFNPPTKTVVKETTLDSGRHEKPADEKAYEKVRRYFVEMGVGEELVPIMRQAPHTSIRWIRIAELQSTRLATDFVNGEELIAKQLAALPHPTLVTVAPATPAVSRPGVVIGPGATIGPGVILTPAKPTQAPAPVIGALPIPAAPTETEATPPPSAVTPVAPVTAAVTPASAVPTPSAPASQHTAASPAPSAVPAPAQPPAVKVASPQPEAPAAATPAAPKAKPAPKPRARAAKADDKPAPFTFFPN